MDYHSSYPVIMQLNYYKVYHSTWWASIMDCADIVTDCVNFPKVVIKVTKLYGSAQRLPIRSKIRFQTIRRQQSAACKHRRRVRYISANTSFSEQNMHIPAAPAYAKQQAFSAHFRIFQADSV